MNLVGPGLALLVVGLAARSVEASDNGLPRTPVVFYGTPDCIEVVDRSADPMLQFDYTLPLTDTCVGPDELPDSRTYQFFAMCRAREPWETMPAFIDDEDVQACVDHGVIMESEQPPAEGVLAQSPAWEDCSYAITDKTERRPITCEAAAPGVQWDTRDVPEGAYVIYGYTFHPPLGTWVRRGGVIKVIDDAQSDPPAIGLHPHHAAHGTEGPLMLSACVDAPPGSTVRGYYAYPVADEPEWIEFANQPLEQDGDVALALDLRDQLDAVTVFSLMVEVTDPDGRSFRYVSPQDTTYVPWESQENEPPPDFDYCRDDPRASEPQMCGPTSTSTDGGDESDGCAGCRLGSNGTSTPWALLSIGLALLTVRRSCRSRRDLRCSSCGTRRTRRPGRPR